MASPMDWLSKEEVKPSGEKFELRSSRKLESSYIHSHCVVPSALPFRVGLKDTLNDCLEIVRINSICLNVAV